MNHELLIFSAKSGSDWGLNELAAYNIQTERQDAATFSRNAPSSRTVDMLDKLEAEYTTDLDAFRTIFHDGPCDECDTVGGVGCQ